MTDKEKVYDVFYSQIREKYEIPEDLISNWFRMSVWDYSNEIRPLEYDPATETFSAIKGSEILCLGYLMCEYYVRREISRISKLNNIIGKDIQLNSTAAAKQAIRQEMEDLRYRIEQRLYRLKTPAYN